MLSPRFYALFLSLCLALPVRAGEIVVATYNVQNYVDEQPLQPGQRFALHAKSEKAMDAVIRVIRDIHPDILGLCEMGSPEKFADFKARLAAAGLEYSDSEYVQGADPDRHLALVSRFPIVARQSQTDVSFVLNGQPEKVRRGFLDVTVRVRPGCDLRLVGVHLKSKLATLAGEALVRRNEAQLLRRHLERILTAAPETKLLCYGDFNDTKNEPVFQEITGVRGTPTYLADLWAKDEFGDRWTEYWKAADLYSRIDYLFVSPALFRQVVPQSARVYRSDFWLEASDHRAVFATISTDRK